MVANTEKLYAERMKRYVTAMRNEKPDRVPIRPFAAEFVATYAGYTHQEVTHDLEKVFAATRKCAADFEWDATVPNMVHIWAGLTEAIGLNYYAYPGVHLPHDTGQAQYVEPSEEEAFLRADEYDQFIEDPTGFLFNVWFPRVTHHVSPAGEPTSLRNNLSFLKGGMAMLTCFNALGRQCELLRSETGTVSAISGILKAPLDILGDKFRGYLGLCMDLHERRDKVIAAAEALMPHMLHMALSGADPDKNVPITIWMHRGCVPFISQEDFDTIYWPTLKPIVEEIWSRGHQVLFYAEGKWAAHLHAFAEIPARSIIFHVDQDDIFEAHRVLGDKFCISGGMPNFLLGYGTADQVRARCKEVIDGVGRDGGYIMDASAIMLSDSKPENVKAMCDFTREYGVY